MKFPLFLAGIDSHTKLDNKSQARKNIFILCPCSFAFRDWWIFSNLTNFSAADYKISNVILLDKIYDRHDHFWRTLKKYSTSSMASSAKSVQWTQFLPLSFPYLALMDFGRTFRAISGSWGPQSSRKAATGLFWRTYKAMHGPLVIYSISWLYSGTTFLYTSKNYCIKGIFT